MQYSEHFQDSLNLANLSFDLSCGRRTSRKESQTQPTLKPAISEVADFLFMQRVLEMK